MYNVPFNKSDWLSWMRANNFLRRRIFFLFFFISTVKIECENSCRLFTWIRINVGMKYSTAFKWNFNWMPKLDHLNGIRVKIWICLDGAHLRKHYSSYKQFFLWITKNFMFVFLKPKINQFLVFPHFKIVSLQKESS